MKTINPLSINSLNNSILRNYITDLEYSVEFSFDGKCPRNTELNAYTILSYKGQEKKEVFIYTGKDAEQRYNQDKAIINSL